MGVPNTCLRRNLAMAFNAPFAACAMVQNQPSDCISTTSTVPKTKTINLCSSMRIKSRSVVAAWSINLDQPSICTSKRNTVGFILMARVRNQTQEGRTTEKTTETAIKELTRKSRASMTRRVKSAILWQRKEAMTGCKKQTSQLFVADVEGPTAALLLSTFTSRKTTTEFLQREQSEAQEGCVQRKKASRVPTSSNPLKNL